MSEPTDESQGDSSLGTADPRNASTFLFVPGDRPERFDKAVAARADQVILDLEDAVGDDQKPKARTHVVDWLADRGSGCVRINAAATSWYADDVAALRHAPGLQAVVLPMADDPQAVIDLYAELNVPVIALIESSLGLIRAPDIAGAEGVCRLALGALDLAADLGTDHHQVIDYARIQLVIASSAAGRPGPIDSPDPSVSAPTAAGAAARKAQALGMSGKFCIHPRQVNPVAAAFMVSSEEAAWAERVLDAATQGVSVVDGMMVDAPVIERARAVMKRVGRNRAT